MKNTVFTILTLAGSVLFITSQGCNKKKPEEQRPEVCDTISPTYEADAKAIIDLTCAYSGCHASGGSAPGDYTTYDGMKAYLDNGSFKDRVVTEADNDSKRMPPVYATNGPTELTQEQFDILQCWLLDGYPEN